MSIQDIIFFLLFMWFAVGNVIILGLIIFKVITCRKVKNCKNRKCLFNYDCPKYDKRLTKEEYDYLMKLLDETYKENAAK